MAVSFCQEVELGRHIVLFALSFDLHIAVVRARPFPVQTQALLQTITVNTGALITIQILDDVAAAIFGVVSVLGIADLMQGSGRFILTLGAISTAVGIGASFSQVIAGSTVHHFAVPPHMKSARVLDRSPPHPPQNSLPNNSLYWGKYANVPDDQTFPYASQAR